MAYPPSLPLPEGIISSYVDCTSVTGLKFHILTSGTNVHSNGLLLFCHGFPELAYSWRHVLPYFGAKGYYAVAFDQRGYGRTTGWDERDYAHVDIAEFGPTQNVIDVLALVSQLGRSHVDIIIGHDFGAVTAASCAMMRPDFFKACVIMSHPFEPEPSMPGTGEIQTKGDPDIHRSLASVERKHYKWANSTPTAAREWDHPAQGLESFLRGYFFLKSASDQRNKPHRLESWTAAGLAVMPHYYVPKLDYTMAETVAEDTIGQEVSSTYSWLPDDDLAVYVQEWTRTGFQGALNWYRNRTIPNPDMRLFAGKKISVPTIFISGMQDWGNEQKPGVLERLPEACEDFQGEKLINGAGHWPQQEKPVEVCKEIEGFLEKLKG